MDPELSDNVTYVTFFPVHVVKISACDMKLQTTVRCTANFLNFYLDTVVYSRSTADDKSP